jgi:hypothetical protein
LKQFIMSTAERLFFTGSKRRLPFVNNGKLMVGN